MMPVNKAAEVARTLGKPSNPGRASSMGPVRDNVFTHDVAGGNLAVGTILGHEEQGRLNAERLSSTVELAVVA